MKRLSLGRKSSGLRARRWDAIVLGGALPGIVAAARMGQRGHRVLVVEEEASARLPAALRDPFFLGPPAGEGVVDACLAALKIGLRDRRRIEAEDITYQVVSPDARLDVGSPVHTVRELVGWGVAKPERARDVVRSLTEAAQGQLGALLDAPLVRRSGLRGLSRGRSQGSTEPQRQLPDLAFLEDPELQGFFAPQLEALSQVVGGALPAAARARLLGSALLGGGGFSSSEVTLLRLLRRRVEELHGELRTVRGFELVVVDPHPGISISASREVWLGRVLVLNAPLGLVGAALREQEERALPPFLEVPPPERRRIVLDLRCDPEVIPEGMARRVIVASQAPEAGVVSIARWAGRAAHDPIQLVARMLIGARDDPEQARQTIVDAVRDLMPFSEGRLLQREHPRPQWDDNEVVFEAARTASWPPEIDLRLSTRPPIYGLPREPLAALGTEGDILLGWRAGDTISEDL